jgi:hypothetical protein
MAIPSSGSFTLKGNIQGEFGGSTPTSLTEYYKNGSYVKTNANNSSLIPRQGKIDMSDFRGAGPFVRDIKSFTINITKGIPAPSTNTRFQVGYKRAGTNSPDDDRNVKWGSIQSGYATIVAGVQSFQYQAYRLPPPTGTGNQGSPVVAGYNNLAIILRQDTGYGKIGNLQSELTITFSGYSSYSFFVKAGRHTTGTVTQSFNYTAHNGVGYRFVNVSGAFPQTNDARDQFGRGGNPFGWRADIVDGSTRAVGCTIKGPSS